MDLCLSLSLPARKSFEERSFLSYSKVVTFSKINISRFCWSLITKKTSGSCERAIRKYITSMATKREQKRVYDLQRVRVGALILIRSLCEGRYFLSNYILQRRGARVNYYFSFSSSCARCCLFSVSYTHLTLPTICSV